MAYEIGSIWVSASRNAWQVAVRRTAVTDVPQVRLSMERRGGGGSGASSYPALAVVNEWYVHTGVKHVRWTAGDSIDPKVRAVTNNVVFFTGEVILWPAPSTPPTATVFNSTPGDGITPAAMGEITAVTFHQNQGSVIVEYTVSGADLDARSHITISGPGITTFTLTLSATQRMVGSRSGTLNFTGAYDYGATYTLTLFNGVSKQLDTGTWDAPAAPVVVTPVISVTSLAADDTFDVDWSFSVSGTPLNSTVGTRLRLQGQKKSDNGWVNLALHQLSASQHLVGSHSGEWNPQTVSRSVYDHLRVQMGDRRNSSKWGHSLPVALPAPLPPPAPSVTIDSVTWGRHSGGNVQFTIQYDVATAALPSGTEIQVLEGSTEIVATTLSGALRAIGNNRTQTVNHADLEWSTEYVVRISDGTRHYASKDSTSPADPQADNDPPGAPTSLAITAVSSASITFAVGVVPDATGYRFEVGEDSAYAGALVEDGQAATATWDVASSTSASALGNNVSLYARVRAKNDNGNSGWFEYPFNPFNITGLLSPDVVTRWTGYSWLPDQMGFVGGA